MKTRGERIDRRFDLIKRILDNTEAEDILWERYLPNSYSAEWNGQKLIYEALQDARPVLHICDEGGGSQVTIRNNESDSIAITFRRLDSAIRAQGEGIAEQSLPAPAEPSITQESPYVEKLLSL